MKAVCAPHFFDLEAAMVSVLRHALALVLARRLSTRVNRHIYLDKQGLPSLLVLWALLAFCVRVLLLIEYLGGFR